MSRFWIAAGAIIGLLSVALSAWAAHGLAVEPARLRMAEAAINQGGWHALALVATGLLAERRAGRLPHLAGGAFLLGILLFCGGVWGVVLTGRSVGPIAPVGGMLLIIGWLLLALAALRRPA